MVKEGRPSREIRLPAKFRDESIQVGHELHTCICKKPFKKDSFMVSCEIKKEGCPQWFHGSCVGLTIEESKKMRNFICSFCADFGQENIDYITLNSSDLVIDNMENENLNEESGMPQAKKARKAKSIEEINSEPNIHFIPVGKRSSRKSSMQNCSHFNNENEVNVLLQNENENILFKQGVKSTNLSFLKHKITEFSEADAMKELNILKKEKEKNEENNFEHDTIGMNENNNDNDNDNNSDNNTDDGNDNDSDGNEDGDRNSEKINYKNMKRIEISNKDDGDNEDDGDDDDDGDNDNDGDDDDDDGGNGDGDDDGSDDANENEDENGNDEDNDEDNVEGDRDDSNYNDVQNFGNEGGDNIETFGNNSNHDVHGNDDQNSKDYEIANKNEIVNDDADDVDDDAGDGGNEDDADDGNEDDDDDDEGGEEEEEEEEGEEEEEEEDEEGEEKEGEEEGGEEERGEEEKEGDKVEEEKDRSNNVFTLTDKHTSSINNREMRKKEKLDVNNHHNILNDDFISLYENDNMDANQSFNEESMEERMQQNEKSNIEIRRKKKNESLEVSKQLHEPSKPVDESQTNGDDDDDDMNENEQIDEENINEKSMNLQYEENQFTNMYNNNNDNNHNNEMKIKELDEIEAMSLLTVPEGDEDDDMALKEDGLFYMNNDESLLETPDTLNQGILDESNDLERLDEFKSEFENNEIEFNRIPTEIQSQSQSQNLVANQNAPFFFSGQVIPTISTKSHQRSKLTVKRKSDNFSTNLNDTFDQNQINNNDNDVDVDNDDHNINNDNNNQIMNANIHSLQNQNSMLQQSSSDIIRNDDNSQSLHNMPKKEKENDKEDDKDDEKEDENDDDMEFMEEDLGLEQEELAFLDAERMISDDIHYILNSDDMGIDHLAMDSQSMANFSSQSSFPKVEESLKQDLTSLSKVTLPAVRKKARSQMKNLNQIKEKLVSSVSADSAKVCLYSGCKNKVNNDTYYCSPNCTKAAEKETLARKKSKEFKLNQTTVIGRRGKKREKELMEENLFIPVKRSSSFKTTASPKETGSEKSHSAEKQTKGVGPESLGSPKPISDRPGISITKTVGMDRSASFSAKSSPNSAKTSILGSARPLSGSGLVKSSSLTSNSESNMRKKLIESLSQALELVYSDKKHKPESNDEKKEGEGEEGKQSKESDERLPDMENEPKAVEDKPSEKGGGEGKKEIESFGGKELSEKEIKEKAAIVAEEIESEMYIHFNGAGKKYRERARSLLFNLKDPKNPELRSRVLSGEISAASLCSMTVDDLASKELSKWRSQKAKEHALQVVLTDSIDVRRVLKKTHKGEVEVDLPIDSNPPLPDNPVTLDPSVGSPEVKKSQSSVGSLMHVSAEKSENVSSPEAKIKAWGDSESSFKPEKVKKSKKSPEKVKLEKYEPETKPSLTTEANDQVHNVSLAEGKGEKSKENLKLKDLDEGNKNVSISSEKDISVISGETKTENEEEDESKSISNNLPSIMSMEEYMASLSKKEEGIKEEEEGEGKVEAQEGEGEKEGKDDAVELEQGNKEENEVKKEKEKEKVKKKEEKDENEKGLVYTVPKFDNHHPHRSKSSSPKVKKSTAVEKSSQVKSSQTIHREKLTSLWYGELILSRGKAFVKAVFRCGELLSLHDFMPDSVEAKGRVKLSELDKFLFQLHSSYSRSVMVVSFISGSDNDDSSSQSIKDFLSAAEQYKQNQRVGFAEPSPGVELYLLPVTNASFRLLQTHRHYLDLEEKWNEAKGELLIGIIVRRKPTSQTKHTGSDEGKKKASALGSERSLKTKPEKEEAKNEIEIQPWDSPTENIFSKEKFSSARESFSPENISKTRAIGRSSARDPRAQRAEKTTVSSLSTSEIPKNYESLQMNIQLQQEKIQQQKELILQKKQELVIQQYQQKQQYPQQWHNSSSNNNNSQSNYAQMPQQHYGQSQLQQQQQQQQQANMNQRSYSSQSQVVNYNESNQQVRQPNVPPAYSQQSSYPSSESKPPNSVPDVSLQNTQFLSSPENMNLQQLQQFLQQQQKVFPQQEQQQKVFPQQEQQQKVFPQQQQSQAYSSQSSYWISQTGQVNPQSTHPSQFVPPAQQQRPLQHQQYQNQNQSQNPPLHQYQQQQPAPFHQESQKDNDDLPEFDFSMTSIPKSSQPSSQNVPNRFGPNRTSMGDLPPGFEQTQTQANRTQTSPVGSDQASRKYPLVFSSGDHNRGAAGVVGSGVGSGRYQEASQASRTLFSDRQHMGEPTGSLRPPMRSEPFVSPGGMYHPTHPMREMHDMPPGHASAFPRPMHSLHPRSHPPVPQNPHSYPPNAPKPQARNYGPTDAPPLGPYRQDFNPRPAWRGK